MKWSPQQAEALDDVGRWIRSPDRQVYRLFGYAGTGKTTLARHLADQSDGLVAFGAYTGKAASVMRKSGCRDATTIHSMIYLVRQKGTARLRELQRRFAEHLEFPEEEQDQAWINKFQAEISKEKEDLKQPGFVLNPDAEIQDADLVVIDECSMVGEEMARDLMSFGAPILVLGDPAQLPPVKSKSFFVGRDPDFLLTEIHRQALDNPIIYLATRVRNGEGLQTGTFGESRVVKKYGYRPDWTSGAQVLVGLNKTRTKGNKRIRWALGRGHSSYPVVGDRLVCLRNNHKSGLLNGTTWRVEGFKDEDDADTIEISISSEDDGRRLITEALKCHFIGEEAPPHAWQTADEFDYGYALTVHKAQGSQWSDVIVIDESHRFREEQRRSWLYTAITRASDSVTIVR